MFRLFKNKPKDEPYIPPKVVSRKLYKVWHDAKAAYRYMLVVEEEYTPHNELITVFMGMPMGKGRMVNGTPITFKHREYGNLAWAKRMAKHYKLKIENKTDVTH